LADVNAAAVTGIAVPWVVHVCRPQVADLAALSLAKPRPVEARPGDRCSSRLGAARPPTCLEGSHEEDLLGHATKLTDAGARATSRVRSRPTSAMPSVMARMRLSLALGPTKHAIPRRGSARKPLTVPCSRLRDGTRGARGEGSCLAAISRAGSSAS